MALTIEIDGYGEITNAENTTNWGVVGGGGVSETQETDLVLQGSYAVSVKASGKVGWLYYDIGSGNELDYSSGGAQEGELIYMWMNVTTIGSLDTLANNSFRIQLGTSTTNYSYWTLGGSDVMGNNYSGGWICIVLDPTKTPTGTNGTGLDVSSVRYFGGYVDMSGLSKSENFIIDTIASGKGLKITGTDSTGWQEVSDYCNDYTNRAWGMFQERAGIYYAYGTISISGANFTDDARVIKFDTTEYYNGSSWVPTISDDQSGLILLDDNTNSLTFSDGIQVGSGDSSSGRSGSTFIGHNDISVKYKSSDIVNSSSDVDLYGTQFQNFRSDIYLEPDADHSMSGITFSNCGMVYPGSNVIRNCTFSSHSSAASAAFYWDTNTNIKNSNFLGNTLTSLSLSGYGILIPQSGTYNFSNLNFSGNDWDILYTGSAGTTATINSSDATNHPSTWYAPYGGTVDIIVSVTLTLTGLISGSEVRIFIAGTTTELSGVESSGTTFEYSYNYTPNTYVDIVVHHVDYVYYRIDNYELPSNSASIPIQQQWDRWYSNP